MENSLKNKLKVKYLKLFKYDIPISLEYENYKLLRSEEIKLNRVFCILNFDDLSPLADNSGYVGRGGNINDEISKRFKTLLCLFPELGVTHFMVPDFHPVDKNYFSKSFSILKESNLEWLDYYLDLQKKFNIEYACHGMHHRQYDNYLFARNTEFAYTKYDSSLKLLKTSIEIFEKAGIKPIGFRPPGWDINSDFSIIDSIKAAGLKYGALNSYDGGLNANITRVSNTNPIEINGLINFPDNINIDWSIDVIKSEIRKLVDLGGIISIKCHFSNEKLTNSFCEENYNKLVYVLNHIKSEYSSDVTFGTFKDVYFEIEKMSRSI